MILLLTSLLCLSIGSLLLQKNPLNQLKFEIVCNFTILIILILILFNTDDFYIVLFSILCAIPVGLTIPLKTKRMKAMKIV